MSCRVVLARKASRDLDALPEKSRERMLAALRALGEDSHLGKRLIGKLAGVRSYRVWPYRILYMVKRRPNVVLVIRIAHRQRAYRR